MTDPRLRQLAENLVRYSCRIEPGEKVLIEIFDCEDIVAQELVAAVYRAGGQPFVNMIRSKVQLAWLMELTEEQARAQLRWDEARMKEMDAYIAFRGNDNASENADVPRERMNVYQTIYSNRVHSEIRVPGTKWVVLRYPNSAMAQQSGMSTESFEDLYFKVCNLDYAKMSRAMTPLAELMNRTDRVRLVAPNTDISFSIKDIPSVKCDGHRNIPDGEVYTAPVRTSVNGKIKYNAPSFYQGYKFEDVSFTFKDGKIIEAHANDDKRINEVLDTDEGARYIGEFALGVNPHINKPMGDILFDEKISGSIHFTPGNCYEKAYNGNKSAIHWDLVLIMTPEYGGGEIYFDDVLIRKDGRFVLDELKDLNPEKLS